MFARLNRAGPDSDVDATGERSYNPAVGGQVCALALRALTSVGICSDARNSNLWQNRHNPTMKHSLTVAILFTLAALATLAVRARAERQVASTTGQGRAAATSTTVTARTPQDGNALLTQAIVELNRVPAFESKLRVQTHMMGQELSGTGTYYQLTRSPEMLFKLELKLQVANQVSSLLQVSDGRFLWTRRDLPNNKYLGRVDQRRLNEALVQAKRQAPISAESPLTNFGGLKHSLERLAGHFAFDAPRAESLGTTPVWVLVGHWRPAVLAGLWGDKTAAIQSGQDVDLTEAPAYMPTRVTVVLARDPEQHLFPYRIDYERVSKEGEVTTMLSLEYFDIRRNISLDPRLFAYKPGDQEVDDTTEEQLRGLGL